MEISVRRVEGVAVIEPAGRLDADLAQRLRETTTGLLDQGTQRLVVDFGNAEHIAGAAIRWITPEQYADRDALMEREAERLASAEQAKVYVIPEGGSNALGAWGYVRCAEELAQQLGREEATVIYAVGSGGTAAGLIAGEGLMGLIVAGFVFFRKEEFWSVFGDPTSVLAALGVAAIFMIILILYMVLTPLSKAGSPDEPPPPAISM